MTNDLVGKRLGKYEMQAEGYDPLLDRRVAVKVLAPHLVWEPGFVDRFLREARSAARLKHTGIVTIYDVGQEGSWYYIVMEYLEGQTLTQLIRHRGALPNKKVLAVLRQLAEALDYAHHHGLVHRDVKPGNIMVSQTGHVTLTDFGVARAAQETRLTTTGALVGTPQYMSPEQAQGQEVDHRTDIYSLGVVAYEMLVGRAPFTATTPHAVLHQLIYDPPPPMRSRRPDLPVETDQVLAKALAKEPAGRYETAKGFVDAFGQVLAGPGTRPAKPRPPARPRESARPRQRGQALWLAWLLASAAGWAVGWMVGGLLGEAVGRPIGEAMDLIVAEIVGGAATWATLGLVLGVAQWLVLRRFIQDAGWWVLASVAGCAVVGSVKWGQGLLMEAVFFETMGWIEEMEWWTVGPLIGIGLGMFFDGLAGLVVGSAQWLVLQRRVQKAGRWVLINVVAWAIGAVVIGGIGWALGEPDEETMRWLMSILGGIVPGAITAAGMVRLLPRKGRELAL
jgi:hypothetical protein